MSDKHDTQTAAQAVPQRRSAKTFRAVLQQYDPALGRYRDIKSIRLESATTTPTTVERSWSAAMSKVFGSGS